MGGGGTSAGRSRFGADVATFYEDHLVPMIFEPYAADLSARVATLGAGRILETAAGTGAATRRIVRAIPAASVVATDASEAMVAVGRGIVDDARVAWRQADAMDLPFEDGAFDAVACQFGAMFFPDKARAFAEARRVLRPGGVLLFSVWDEVGANAFAGTVADAVARVFPDDPPSFLARVPHGYHDRDAVSRDLASAGFERTTCEAVVAIARARSAGAAATAFCQGTPLRGEIEARGAERLAEATTAAERALADRFGPGKIEGGLRAFVWTAVRGNERGTDHA